MFKVPFREHFGSAVTGKGSYPVAPKIRPAPKISPSMIFRMRVLKVSPTSNISPSYISF